ncbi:MAG TPA: chemotaxis protein CheB [Rudaea sp.]|jgi:two-component system chemotaxis response regulator CheB|nr:chemotaxis protein CheB [Rudaea sp.]
MKRPADAMPRIDAVVIGTSAGGVEALSRILPSIPASMKAAILVVIHVPRERPSLLSELFRAKCQMMVEEAIDKADIESGHIYFAPPDYHLLVDSGPQIALSVDDLVQYSRPSIDVLFESAADVYGARLLGVLLTGGNEDGAAGLAYIARCGGTTVLQDPAEAVAAAMPEGALKVMKPTHVLHLDGIRDLLMDLATKTVR